MPLPSQFNIPTLDGVTLNRYLRKDSIERAVKFLRLGLICLSVILAILLLKLIITRLLTINTSISEAQNKIDFQISENSQSSGNSSLNKKNNYDALKSKSPFGEAPATTQQTSAPQATPAKVSNLALNLIGTFLTPGTEPYAIIENKKDGSQEIYNKGNTVFEEAELVSIQPSKVEIKRNGQIEILKLDDTPDVAGDGTSSGSGVGETVVVPETDLNKALENLPLLLTQARAVPYFKDGQSVGLRLFAIKTGSLYEQIGLRNGDILKTINGNSLGDITQAVKLFEKLKTERSVSLTLERNRQEQTMNYQIK